MFEINIYYILLIIGFILILYQYAYNQNKCTKQVVYRYIPRDFNLDSTLPDGVSYMYKKMFENPTPYTISLGNTNYRKLSNTNFN